MTCRWILENIGIPAYSSLLQFGTLNLCIATVLIPKNAGIVFSGVELRDVGQLIWACFIPHGSLHCCRFFGKKKRYQGMVLTVIVLPRAFQRLVF